MTQKVNLGYQWLTQQTIRFDPRLSLELNEVLHVRILKLVRFASIVQGIVDLEYIKLG